MLVSNVAKVMNGEICEALICKLHSHKFSTDYIPDIVVHSKSDILMCPVFAVFNYLKIRLNLPGLLFLDSLGRPVLSGWVLSKMRQLLDILKLDSDGYNLHSLRIGAATDWANQGKSITQIKLMGRWKSYAFIKYLRPNSVHL